MINVLEWLEADVAAKPDKLAFADDERELSYAQLDEHARSVGSFLAARVCDCAPIACYLEKSTYALFANVYGPTEVTCNCTYQIIDEEYEDGDVIPMGVAFPNEKVLLLDEGDRPVSAAGVEGEICVGGTALALGYYNEPERTAKAFVQNPLNASYPETIYRTGDIGMLDERGRFVYVGRKDHQIKHLGQRIELGEIDAAAQSVKGVTRACALYDSKRKRILMFYTGECEKDAFLDALREKLPQYMVPNKTRQIEQMPLNKNGKIDRQALLSMGKKKR